MPALTTPPGELGQKCPDFNLPGTDGKTYSRSQIQANSPFLVMFICNHCPYVIAIQDRLIQLGKDLKDLGIPVFAISSNDAVNYPDDSFEKMKVLAQEKKYPFPYLYDETQKVAKDFGAVCTPDFFLYDKGSQLAYRGRLDDNWKQASLVTQRDLFQAAKNLKDGVPVPKTQIPSMGCSLKWKT